MKRRPNLIQLSKISQYRNLIKWFFYSSFSDSLIALNDLFYQIDNNYGKYNSNYKNTGEDKQRIIPGQKNKPIDEDSGGKKGKPGVKGTFPIGPARPIHPNSRSFSTEIPKSTK